LKYNSCSTNIKEDTTISLQSRYLKNKRSKKNPKNNIIISL